MELDLSPEVETWYKSLSPQDISQIISCAYAMYTIGGRRPLPATQSAATVGAAGESYVYDILRQHFTIADTTHVAKSGDFMIVHGLHKVMIEVKNYSRPVPYEEVDKFIRDLDATGSSGGVFISLTAPITRLPRCTIRYETSNGKLLPAIYISEVTSSDQSLIISSISMLLSLVDTAKFYRDIVNHRVLVSAMMEVGEKIDAISKTRVNISEINIKMMNLLTKSNHMLTSADTALHLSYDSLRDQLTPPEFVGGESILAGYTYVCDTAMLTNIIHAIEVLAPRTLAEPTWKKTKFKLTNIPTGISLLFTKSHTEFVYPAEFLLADTIREAFLLCRDHIRLDQLLYIEINVITLPFILRLTYSRQTDPSLAAIEHPPPEDSPQVHSVDE